MEWYKKALLGAGLLGLSSLAGYGGESVKSETVLILSNNGKVVRGKIDNMDINYWISNNVVKLKLERGTSEVLIEDGGMSNTTIDGNLNFLELITSDLYKCLFLKDNGDPAYGTWSLTEGEAEKLKEWGNKKLCEAHQICQEKFGDKLKIPYKAEKKPENLGDTLKDFDF